HWPARSPPTSRAALAGTPDAEYVRTREIPPVPANGPTPRIRAALRRPIRLGRYPVRQPPRARPFLCHPSPYDDDAPPGWEIRAAADLTRAGSRPVGDPRPASSPAFVTRRR